MAISETAESPSGETGPDFAGVDLEEALEKLGTSIEGLSADQARQRLQQYGPNSLVEKRVSPLLQFFSRFF